MAAGERRLLVAQHEWRLCAPSGTKNETSRPPARLLVGAVRIAPGDRGVVEGPARDGCRVL